MTYSTKTNKKRLNVNMINWQTALTGTVYLIVCTFKQIDPLQIQHHIIKIQR